MDFSHLGTVEQFFVGIFLVVLFIAWIAIIGFILYLTYLQICNVFMLNKWLRKQLDKDSTPDDK